MLENLIPQMPKKREVSLTPESIKKEKVSLTPKSLKKSGCLSINFQWHIFYLSLKNLLNTHRVFSLKKENPILFFILKDILKDILYG